jgi:hypothetical protein
MVVAMDWCESMVAFESMQNVRTRDAHEHG